jgi:hypothetical protein
MDHSFLAVRSFLRRTAQRIGELISRICPPHLYQSSIFFPSQGRFDYPICRMVCNTPLKLKLKVVLLWAGVRVVVLGADHNLRKDVAYRKQSAVQKCWHKSIVPIWINRSPRPATGNVRAILGEGGSCPTDSSPQRLILAPKVRRRTTE